MQTLTLEVPESLLDELQPYRDNLDGLLKAGLRQVKLDSALPCSNAVISRCGRRRAWLASRYGK